MLTTVASVPAYSLPGVPPLAQPRAAGDPPDSGLATEILPAPPSLASLHQALAAKQDPKKPSQPISYLPQHDPGTTFSSYWATPNSNSAQSGETEGRRPKRVRASKEAGGLAARGSFRGAFHAPSVVEPVVVEDTAMLDTFDTALDSEAAPAIDTDNMTASRSNSVPPSQPQDSRRRGRPLKDKGKGRDGGDIRVKEEPITVTLPPADGPSSSLRNQDHCSACRSLGSLVYCDSCTRAYHLLCLDPPMEASDLPEGENRWYCPACHLSKNPRPKPPPSFLSSLIQQVQTAPPTEFQLPEDIRTYFKHVGTNTRGAYMDTSVLRPPRLNRLGQLEDRDPHRTKDRNGVPVLCFRCGTSAYTTPVVTSISSPSLNKRPRRSTTQSRQSSEVEWRSIVSCDYCSSHWHLDCLDPPLTSMPPFDKKWMCPNHAEHVLRVKPRIPKQNPTVIDVSHPGVLNNGNIEVLESGDSSYENKVLVDEVFINGRKYRVPERVIKLDFWNKLSNTEPNPPPPSSPAISVTSSLTSLSSLDEIGPPPSTSATSSTPGVSSKPDLSTWDVNDLRGALLLLDFTQENTAAPVPARFTPRPTARPAPARSAPRPLPARNAPRVKQEPLQSDTILLTAPPPAMYSRTPGPTTEPYYPPFSTSVFSAPILPSTTAPVPAATSAPDAGRRQPARASKREIIYTLPGLDDDTDSGSSRPPPKARKPARQRAPRKSAPPRASVAPPVNSTADAALRSTPSAHPPINAAGALQSSANVTPTNGTTKSPQTTPSLKIRLPRLSDLKPQSQAHVQAQTQAQAQAPVSPTPTAKVRRSARRSEPAGESKAEE